MISRLPTLSGLALVLAFSAMAASARAETAAPAEAAAPPLHTYASPLPMGGVESELADAAKLYGLDPALVKAVAQQESGLRQEARSHRGAVGVMQLMPKTARDMGIDPNDMRQNIRGGVGYLSQMMDTFGGDVSRALAAYNAGPGAVMKHGGVPPFAETRHYVSTIMAHAAINAAAGMTQPLSTQAAELGGKAMQMAAQAAGQLAGQASAPLAVIVGAAAASAPAAGQAMVTAGGGQ